MTLSSPPPIRLVRRLVLALLLVAGVVSVVIIFQSIRQNQRPGMIHFQRGDDAITQHNMELAEREWLQGTREDPDFGPCFEQLGELYMMLRRPEEAEVNFARAVKLNPKDGILTMKLARMQHLTGRSEEAYRNAQRAAELLPNDYEAVGDYGMLAAEHKNPAVALNALRRAYTLHPEESKYLMGLAGVELDNLDYNSVEIDLKPFLAKYPNDPQANYFMAVVYNQRPRSKENVATALAYAQRAYPGMRDDARIYPLLGQLFLNRQVPGSVQDALNCFLAGHQQLPTSEDMLHGMVQCYALLRDSKRQAAAAAEFEKLVARHDRVKHLKHLLSFNNHDAVTGLELAHLLEQDGKNQEARHIYENLAALLPADAKVQKELKAFYARLSAAPPRPDSREPMH